MGLHKLLEASPAQSVRDTVAQLDAYGRDRAADGNERVLGEAAAAAGVVVLPQPVDRILH